MVSPSMFTIAGFDSETRVRLQPTRQRASALSRQSVLYSVVRTLLSQQEYHDPQHYDDDSAGHDRALLGTLHRSATNGATRAQAPVPVIAEEVAKRHIRHIDVATAAIAGTYAGAVGAGVRDAADHASWVEAYAREGAYAGAEHVYPASAEVAAAVREFVEGRSH